MFPSPTGRRQGERLLKKQCNEFIPCAFALLNGVDPERKGRRYKQTINHINDDEKQTQKPEPEEHEPNTQLETRQRMSLRSLFVRTVQLWHLHLQLVQLRHLLLQFLQL